jgi:hypothetical protein
MGEPIDCVQYCKACLPLQLFCRAQCAAAALAANCFAVVAGCCCSISALCPHPHHHVLPTAACSHPTVCLHMTVSAHGACEQLTLLGPLLAVPCSLFCY